MCKFFNSYEEFPSEFALFPQNFTQLGKILQDRLAVPTNLKSARQLTFEDLLMVCVNINRLPLTAFVGGSVFIFRGPINAFSPCEN